MAEVGLVLFAKTALALMQEVLLVYSGEYSKHTIIAAVDDHPLPDALR